MTPTENHWANQWFWKGRDEQPRAVRKPVQLSANLELSLCKQLSHIHLDARTGERFPQAHRKGSTLTALSQQTAFWREQTCQLRTLHTRPAGQSLGETRISSLPYLLFKKGGEGLWN